MQCTRLVRHIIFYRHPTARHWSTETQMLYATISRLLGHACFSLCSHVVMVHLQLINALVSMANPGPTHVAATRRVLRYLAGTRSLGLTLTRTNSAHANQLYATADANHVGADDRRSVSGWVVLLNGAMVLWASKRQPATTLSSTETKFYAVSLFGLDCKYLQRMIDMMRYKHIGATAIAQDNNACPFLVKGSSM